MTWTHLACLLLGVVLGVVGDDLFDLPIGKDRRTMKDRLVRIREAMSARRFLTWALLLVVALNAGFAALLVNDRLDKAGLTDCIVTFNQQWTSAYQARTASSIPAQAAQDEAFQAVLDGDPKDIRVAVTKYLDARAKVRADQNANLYPALPDSFCGQELNK